MLAYLFWNRPYERVDVARYEAALMRFHASLAHATPPGLVACGSFRIEAVPWLGDRPGYEDWNLLQGSWAMDPLNAFAVAGATQRAHDDVARDMEEGRGGLYRLFWGDATSPADSAVVWLTRPRGIEWRPILEAVRDRIGNATFWRRQMVLGPAPEFAVVLRQMQELQIPDDWRARFVPRVRLIPGR